MAALQPKKTTSAPHIEVASQLKKVKLSGLPSSCMPDGQAVNALAAEYEKLKQKGIKYPFVYTQLNRYVRMCHFTLRSKPQPQIL